MRQYHNSFYVEIDEDSKIPKFKQVINAFTSDIDSGRLKVGDRMPSINDTSEEFYLSRDTVEKAYKIMRQRGLITSVRGKGFYVASTSMDCELRILLVFNKLSDHKKTIYNAFIEALEEKAVVDLQIHHCKPDLLTKIIMDNLGNYDHYVIMPHLSEETPAVLDALNKIPKDQLLLLNKDIEGVEGDYACVYEDFEKDIFQALTSKIGVVCKYKKMVLIYPNCHSYGLGIRSGFEMFARSMEIEHEVFQNIESHDIREDTLYIVLEELDLVNLIKKANVKGLRLGEEVGIISYHDSPFKEILAGGISVLSTKFETMGETAAKMIFQHKKEKVKNPFYLIVRPSL